MARQAHAHTLSHLALKGAVLQNAPADALAKALQHFTELQSLHLDACGVKQYALMHQLLHGIAECTRLSHLTVSGCALRAAASAHVVVAFPVSLRCLRMRHITHKAEMSVPLMNGVAALTGLQELQLEDVQATDAWYVCDAAAPALTVLTGLTHLTLSHDDSKDRGAAAWHAVCGWLGPWIALQSRLQYLQLQHVADCQHARAGSDESGCRLSSANGWCELAPHLAQATSLTELDLRRNNLPVEAAAALGEHLPSLPALKKVRTAKLRDYLARVADMPSCEPDVLLISVAEALGPRLVALDEQLSEDLRHCRELLQRACMSKRCMMSM